MVHKHEDWIIGRRMTVVGLLVVAMFSVHCKATEGKWKDAQTEPVSRRVIMMPVSVVGTPASGEESAGPQILLYAADKTALPVIPLGIDFVYASSEDHGRSAGANATILDVTIPVTLIGAPDPGEAGYLSEIQVFMVAGHEDMPRIPTEVRIVYASGEKPTLAGPESHSSSSRTAEGALVAARVCSWHQIDGVNYCRGTCVTGTCAKVTVEIGGLQVTTCECITIHQFVE